eukprot:1130274-Prymnesium_polylepis.2
MPCSGAGRRWSVHRTSNSAQRRTVRVVHDPCVAVPVPPHGNGHTLSRPRVYCAGGAHAIPRIQRLGNLPQ